MEVQKFTDKEKNQYLLKLYMKNHLFDYVLDSVWCIAFTLLIIFLCGGTKYYLGILLGFAYSLEKSVREVRSYKKDYIDIKY